MKQFVSFQLPVWAFACLLLSCNKQSSVPGTASLTVINALPGSTPYLITNFAGTDPITWYTSALKISYGITSTASQALSAYSGNQRLGVYRYPDTLAKSAPLYNLTLGLQTGSIYTLFLTGTLTSPDTVFTKDIIPYHPATDSSLGFRFVNLSAGSAPVSVNLTGQANGSEVSSLAYKSITGFKMYPATSAIANYSFEVRDSASGVLLSSLNVTGINVTTTANIRRFRNFTIAYMGLPSDATTRKTILIDTYTPN